MNRKHICFAASLLALGSTLALAAASGEPGEQRRQHGQEGAEARFADADNNHDGRISQSEWQSARLREANEKFRKLDANGDGSLSQQELQAARAQRRARHGGAMREKLREMDTDGDRQLSRAELGQSMPRLAQDFDRLDANADGKLSREEIRAGREQHRGDAKR